MSTRFTPAARRQLLTAVEFMADRRSSAARAFLDTLEKRLQELEQFPATGRHVPEFPELPFREVRVPPYRIFYRTRESGLWVVGVWHDAQMPGEPITK